MSSRWLRWDLKAQSGFEPPPELPGLQVWATSIWPSLDFLKLRFIYFALEYVGYLPHKYLLNLFHHMDFNFDMASINFWRYDEYIIRLLYIKSFQSRMETKYKYLWVYGKFHGRGILSEFAELRTFKLVLKGWFRTEEEREKRESYFLILFLN
jgi:hypothetical protein